MKAQVEDIKMRVDNGEDLFDVCVKLNLTKKQFILFTAVIKTGQADLKKFLSEVENV